MGCGRDFNNTWRNIERNAEWTWSILENMLISLFIYVEYIYLVSLFQINNMKQT